MLGDKQEQSTESGSTALQAGRDINITGLSVSAVRELCVLFLRDNFPQLQAEAKRAAEEQVKAFAAGLEARLVNDAASIAFEKFRDPDVQSAINDAVQASARRGQAANPDILSTLISERVSQNSSEYKDMVVSEAVHVVSKLTRQQIALLAFVHVVRSVVVEELSDRADLEIFAKAVLTCTSPGFGLSESQKQHLQYTGVASVNNTLGGDVYEAKWKAFEYLGFTDAATFKASLPNDSPSYFCLLEQFSKENLFAVGLTSVGQAIAIAHLSNFLGELDYGIWLK